MFRSTLINFNEIMLLTLRIMMMVMQPTPSKKSHNLQVNYNSRITETVTKSTTTNKVHTKTLFQTSSKLSITHSPDTCISRIY